ncbi:cellulase family glycosylhydrolase [Streptomyces sp. TLI_171]|uniref:glycoside hydrolase 5 family protein n=1 Tax=Streptomyces sp. TLI_171 TaxID=1938859 RepID=UPI000C173D15|nr:cellulase family glycosylhydrolase [Streptomyces sp. TLI_171]RKE17819.1 mannan endo-1,4-beta-mannosidase [Streptomyces sp. TLI_171]
MTDQPRTTGRRTLLGAAALGLAATPLLGGAAAAADRPRADRGKRSFVTAGGGQLRLDGRKFRFGGTNCYYLHQQSPYMIDAVLNDAAAMGLTVIRAWAFADGGGHSYRALQTEPYRYDEAAFDSLDYAVHKAGQLGLRLVLPLVNNWPDYGGMQQYVTWFLGLPDDSYGDGAHHDRFYTDANCRKAYRAWAEHVIRRRNRYTGLRYCDDPTVMAWELANEPRCRSDKSGATLLGWAREMSAYVKSLAPRQLLAIGDEGFYGRPNEADYPYSNYEGNDWQKLTALPAVDYGTVHVYPQNWGETSGNTPGVNAADWGTRWINDHLTDGRRLGKPVVVEEFGLQLDAARDIADTAARDAAYRAWTDASLTGGAAGDQFWLLTSRVDDGSFYPDYDGHRIMWNNDPANPTRTTAQLFAAHAEAMTAAG